MTAARLRRLAALEARKPRVFRPFDYAVAAASLRWALDCHAVVKAGEASLVPRYGPRPAPSDAKRRVLGELDQVGRRLAQESR
jgi:hypothetical protein